MHPGRYEFTARAPPKSPGRWIQAKAWAPDQNIFNPADAVPDALILEHSTVAGIIEGDDPVIRVAYVVDDEADFIAEGQEIPESDPQLAEVLIQTAKISKLVPLSNEQYRQASTPEQLSAAVSRAITKRGNLAFLSQAAPTAPATTPSAGLINIDGILDGGTVSDHLDALITAIAQLEAADATPTAIAVSPLAWAALSKLKTGTDSNVGILGAGTENTERRLLGLPVAVTPALTGTTGLIIDRSAIVSAVGPVRIDTDESFFFSSDRVAVRATWRIGWNAVRPERLAKFTVTAP